MSTEKESMNGKQFRYLLDVIRNFNRQGQIHLIYRLSHEGRLSLEEFTKLTKWFWGGMYGLG